ncbi:MAG: hypothetical protein Q9184_003174 [Pyrenodesmia sp. 2 TL-2023]
MNSRALEPSPCWTRLQSRSLGGRARKASQNKKWMLYLPTATSEGCVRGSRECTYPEPKPKSRPKGSKSDSAKPTPAFSEESDSEEEDAGPEPRIQSPKVPKAAGKPAYTESRSRKNSRSKGAAFRRQRAESYKHPITSIEQTKQDLEVRKSPETEESSPLSAARTGSQCPYYGDNLTPQSSMSPEKPSFSHLPQDQRFYLEYLRTNVTYHHYFFRNNANDFVHNTLIEHALSYEPLLHAVLGFAAYHATLERSNGKIQDFLAYYNKSVSLLLKALTSGQKHTEAMLLTILQLATFEEYLGDWVNLIGHQKAAHSMLIELYTVESVMQEELGRKILAWYSRFDLFVGFMSGYETVLGREWFGAKERFHRERAQQHPEDIDARVEAAIASHRFIALDMALLFAKLKVGEITLPEFQIGNEVVTARIRNWGQSLGPLLTDERYIVTSFEGAPKQDEDDIVDPYRLGGLFRGALFPMNFVLVDWLGTNIMHTYQTALITGRPAPPGLLEMALELCRIFESVEYWPESEKGSILQAQAGLGIAALFLPKDERHTMWIRRKLAKIEGEGYTYPPTLREKMAVLWGVPDIRHWWLPNDEGYSPIVRSIHSFTEDRTPQPAGQPTEAVRTMKGLFNNLSFKDS